jgi:hypothetical protein
MSDAVDFGSRIAQAVATAAAMNTDVNRREIAPVKSASPAAARYRAAGSTIDRILMSAPGCRHPRKMALAISQADDIGSETANPAARMVEIGDRMRAAAAVMRLISWSVASL